MYYIGYPFAFELALYDGDAKVSPELFYEPRLYQLAKGSSSDSGLARKSFEAKAAHQLALRLLERASCGGADAVGPRRPVHQEQCTVVEESGATPEREETLDAQAKDESSAAIQIGEPVEEAAEPAHESSSDALLLTEMLSKYDLDDEVDLLAQIGIKKDRDLKYLDEDLIKDMQLTPISKAKLRRIAKTLTERRALVDESEAGPVTEEALDAAAKDEPSAVNKAMEATDTAVAESEVAEGVDQIEPAEEETEDQRYVANSVCARAHVRMCLLTISLCITQ